MTFNSYDYAAFFAIVLAGFWLLPNRARLPLLLTASYFFYATVDWRFLGLLLTSTFVDYFAAHAMGRRTATRDRQLLLALSVAVNLSILGYFKYADFFITSVADLLERTGANIPDIALTIVLPVGISFYTFQSMSYTIDVYRRKIEPTHDPLLFATYVAFFPQLLAGPIERAGHLLPQLTHTRRTLAPVEVREGIDLILLGLFKKVAIADLIARRITAVFGDPDPFRNGIFTPTPANPDWLTLLAGCFALMILVYCDFSGYSDIARGSAKLLGIDLSRNFLRPFASTTYRELWQRWHVTLFDWFRDYVYIPLGGNRRGPTRGYLNIIIVFTLSGLWHGARGGFVLWGFSTGIALVVETIVLDRIHAHRPPRPDGGTPWGRVLASAYVCTLFALLMMPIIVPDISRATEIWGNILTLQSGPRDWALVAIVGYAAAATLAMDARQAWLDHREDDRRAALPTAPIVPWRWGVVTGLMVAGIIVTSGAAAEPFFYFQF